MTSSDHDTDPTSTGSSTFRRALLGVLVVALVVSGGLLIWLLADRQGDAEELQAEREAAMAQARQLALRVGTYGPDMLEGEQMPEYREQVAAVMTPKLADDFEQNGAPLAEQTVAQTQASRSAEVFATGVSVIDEDSAEVLVAGTFETSFPGGGGQGQPATVPFRYVMSLDKIDGTWLVDSYESASEAQ